MKETAILKKMVEGEEAPEFTLRDVMIYHADGITAANLLELDHGGPFIARVRLQIDSDDDDQITRRKYQKDPILAPPRMEFYSHCPYTVVKPDVESAYLEFRVLSYCIGDDPYPMVWAGGEAGWFEIIPHRRYQAMYEHMCRGIRLYYSIMAAYEIAAGSKSIRSRKKVWSKMDLNDVFFQARPRVVFGLEVKQLTRS